MAAIHVRISFSIIHAWPRTFTFCVVQVRFVTCIMGNEIRTCTTAVLKRLNYETLVNVS